MAKALERYAEDARRNGWHRERASYHRSLDPLFDLCNPIYKKATGRTPGGTRSRRVINGSEDDIVGGPCVRFYQALLSCIEARLTHEMRAGDPRLADDLAATPRAILERIQRAEARIRKSHLGERPARG